MRPKFKMSEINMFKWWWRRNREEREVEYKEGGLEGWEEFLMGQSLRKPESME